MGGLSCYSKIEVLLDPTFHNPTDHDMCDHTSATSLEQLSETRLKQTLALIPHFASLPDSIQSEIASKLSPRHYDAGQVIYMEGDPANYVHFLQSGWIKAVRISPEGREQAMLFLKPTEVFGDIAVMTGTPYPCTVIALEPADVWVIQKEDLHELIARYPELARIIIQRLGERVLHYIDLVEDLALRSVESRLANTLLKHVEHTGEQLIVPRRSWATFDEMAVRLGTVRDVLSRALHAFEQEGLLRVERQNIVILDLERLAERGKP